MKALCKIFLILITIISQSSWAYADNASNNKMLSDSRIKNFVYSKNAIYKMIMYTGFQTSIEFEENEEIKNIIIGDASTWQIDKINQMIFIKPLQENIHTNMVVITNYRSYNFEILSVSPGEDSDPLFALIVRFIYK